MYSNSNIYPSEEYYRRLEELKRYVEDFNKKNNAAANLEYLSAATHAKKHSERNKDNGKDQ